MRTVSVTFDEEIYGRLLAIAQQRGIAVAELVQRAAAELCGENDDVTESFDPEFETLIDEMVETYRPVFHRLSQ